MKKYCIMCLSIHGEEYDMKGIFEAENKREALMKSVYEWNKDCDNIDEIIGAAMENPEVYYRICDFLVGVLCIDDE